ncbi:ABC transporter substrate-binding protein [Ancylobacter mangrovi]|uniref:ABC transporter substrate-binding protein n=1 Tax=Ancylobacter mangrovi TaxID=2972472 RepID=UPI00216348D0|nr:extracellular solute-binding protein [Ancylobacter mangrovi]MCS0503728.1 extracellular solute-binding protein [Ancylobacter mangrovi]
MITRRALLSTTGGLVAAATLAPALSRAAGEPDAAFDAAVKAAKGQSLNLIVDPPQAYRDIAAIFAKAYPDINVQTTVMHPSDAAPRVITEQRNKVYSFDAWWGTCTNMNSIAAPAGILAELPPYLLLPSVKDASNWRLPDMLYTSPKPFVFVHTLGLINQGAYNTDLVPGGVLTLDKLLDPSLKKMISIRVPSRPHGGSLMLAQIAKQKGFDFVETLLRTMEPVYVDNDRQNTMSVVRGDTAVGIGTSEETLYSCHQEKGCTNVKVFPTADMQARGVSVLNNAPNQAAVKVFVNWLLSKEGQETYVREWSKTNFGGGFSMRKDVEPGPGQSDSMPDMSHIETYSAVSYDSGWADVQKIISLYKTIQG